MKNARNAERSQYIQAIYSTSQPCPPPYFAGRGELIEFYRKTALVPKLKGLPPQPSNVAFMGGWGIGKTSILNYIRESMEDGEFLKIDLVRDFRNVNELLALTLTKIASSVSRLEKLKGILNRLRSIGISEFGVEFERERPMLADSLARTWSVLEEQGVRHCSILIDDLGGIEERDRKTLRDIFQELLLEGCNYSLIITCTPRVFETPAMEPVTRFFEKVEIEPFTRGETEEAIHKPVDYLERKMEVRLDLSFDESYVDELMGLSLGYPYFVKFITCQLALRFEKVKGVHLSDSRKELVEAMGRTKFERDFGSATERGRQILMRMARRPSEKYKAEEFKGIPHYTFYLKELHDKELLNKDRRGVYSVYHPLFLEWVRRFILKKHER